jgi:hypothetical protein
MTALILIPVRRATINNNVAMRLREITVPLGPNGTQQAKAAAAGSSAVRTSANSSMSSVVIVIAQAASRWLPTAAARVRSRVRSSGICGGQSGAGAGFLRVLRFPC